MEKTKEDVAVGAVKRGRGRPKKVPVVSAASRLEWLAMKLGPEWASIIEGKNSKEILKLCQTAAMTFGEFDNAAKYATTLIQYEEAKPATVVNTNVSSMDDMTDEELAESIGVAVGNVVALSKPRGRS